MKFMAVIQSMRIPFLVLTPVSVFLGVSTVVANQVDVNFGMLVLILFGALLAHIGVNTLNEYFDFKSGLDFTTVKTPFSGGSGALPKHPEMVNAVLAVGVTSLIVCAVIGSFFIWEYGLGIAPIGIIGLFLIIAYTEWISRHPFLCLIAPGIGFGFLMVAGTQYLLEGEYSYLSWLAAMIPLFLVNNLLLLNQYPDIQSDSDVGRNTFPIAYGVEKSNLVYALFISATIAVIVASVFIGYFPALGLIALLPMPLALFSLTGAIKHGENIGSFPQYLGANVAVAILTPLLLGISIIFG
jgi:1,4-dihydroxy-2-naphthoate octaprenyltransferase